VGQQEPVVRNAIIALGTLHEDYQLRGGKYSRDLIRDPNHQHALSLYGNALRQLNQRLSEGSKTANARLAIISSILFTCFEILRRNNMTAVVHYQAGMRELLRQMNLPVADSSTEGTSERMRQEELKDLLRVFARYDIQACTFSKPKADRVNVQLDLVPPTSFTLAEVRDHLDDLLISVYQLVKSDLGMYRYWKTEAVPVEWRMRRDEGIATFEGWMNALEDFFHTAELKLPPADVKSLLGLRLQIKVAIIMLKTCIDSGPEQSFDAFHHDFEDIVSRVERMTTSLNLVEGKPLDNESTSFTMELGIVHPLFFVATKCRHWILRRRAITQLKKAGREGVWEGPIMAILAERLVQIEEDGVSNGDEIPEVNRIHDLEKDVDYEGKRVMVQMTKARDSTWQNWQMIREQVHF
jgi:Fungal specific transcription factor domain